ncbi:hypothetical protein LXL04_035543 [Taraxacum kok-saghyz]
MCENEKKSGNMTANDLATSFVMCTIKGIITCIDSSLLNGLITLNIYVISFKDASLQGFNKKTISSVFILNYHYWFFTSSLLLLKNLLQQSTRGDDENEAPGDGGNGAFGSDGNEACGDDGNEAPGDDGNGAS